MLAGRTEREAGLRRRRSPEEQDLPMVGMVVTISPSLSLYRMVVFPAASSPTIKILISFFPQSLSNIFEIDIPILAVGGAADRRY